MRSICWVGAAVAFGGVLSSVGADIRPFKPKVPDVFTATAAGAVKPRGWMLDRARAAANGLTGHLDEVDEEFRRAWREDFTPPASRVSWEGGAWSIEGGAYWFDGLVRLAAQLGDKMLLDYAQKRLEPVLSRANPKGLGLLWWLDRDDPAVREALKKQGNWFALDNSAKTGRALAALWEVTRDPRIPKVLPRAFDDLSLVRNASSLHMGWAGFDVWCLTGDEKLARTLDAYFADFGTTPVPSVKYAFPPKPETFHMTDERVFGEDWRAQHGVVMNEDMVTCLRAWQWTGQASYRDALYAWQDWIDAHAMQPHGVVVSDEGFGHSGGNRGSETCTVVASAWLKLQMLAATGDGRWADDVERILFNAGPVCVSRDYCRHVYFQSPNRTTPLKPTYRRGETPLTPYRYERKHFPMCCTAALTRLIPIGVQYKWMSDAEGAVAVLYGPDEADVETAGGKVRFATKTDYPFDETVEISVSPERTAEWTLKLRVPAWCSAAEASVNGERVNLSPVRGFASVRRIWRMGDCVRLRLPMTPRFTCGHDGNTGADYGFVSVGPLLMAAPLREFDDNNPVWRQKSDWMLDPDRALQGAKIVRTPVRAGFDWPLDAPLKLKVNALSGPLTLVPYGCARFRVSMFPVAKDGCVKVSQFGYDPVDSTRFIQAALDSGARTVVVDRQKGPWVSRPLFGRSNQEVVFEDGVELVAKRGEFKGLRDSLLFYHQTTNAVVRGLGKKGGVLRMWKCDYRKPPYAPAEWRYALQLRGVNGMTVENMTFRSSGGDGIVVARGSRDVVIRKCVCDDNHRQGISVGDCENLLIEDTVLSNTKGTPPQAGIDIEPDVNTERLINVVLRNCLSKGNAGNGFEMYLDKLDDTSRPISIRFENCRSVGNRHGAAVHGGVSRTDHFVKGKIAFDGCTFENSGLFGISVSSTPAPAFDVAFSDCVVSNARCDVELAVTKLNQGHTDGVRFDNLKVYQPVVRDWCSVGSALGPVPQRIEGTVVVSAPGAEDRRVTLDADWRAKTFGEPVNGGHPLPPQPLLQKPDDVTVEDACPGRLAPLAPLAFVRGARLVFFMEAPGRATFVGRQPPSTVAGRPLDTQPYVVRPLGPCAADGRKWKITAVGGEATEFSFDAPERGFYSLEVPEGGRRFCLDESSVPIAIDVSKRDQIVTVQNGGKAVLTFSPVPRTPFVALAGGGWYNRFNVAIRDPEGRDVALRKDVSNLFSHSETDAVSGFWKLALFGPYAGDGWVDLDLHGAHPYFFLTNQKRWK